MGQRAGTETSTDAEDDRIDAQDIADQRFSKALRGYDRSEVGSYLHRVAAAHRALEIELADARAALEEAVARTSVVGVSPNLDPVADPEVRAALDLREIDVTDAASGIRDPKLPGEDDEVFDQMVRDALERAVRTRLPHHS